MFCHKCGASLWRRSDNKQDEDTRNFGRGASFNLSPGDSFGKRYEIIEEVGRGGMGVVYKAKDKQLNTIVALKMIRMEFLSDESIIERFKKEILLAREISHDNIVRIHDFGEVDEVKFISMQFIEGKSLSEIINESSPLKFETIINITKQICRGLLAAHKKGIVHRDLKPHNIMIDKDNNVYITDFGLAISTDAAVPSTSSHFNSVIGTPQYIAPEQWFGEKVDNRADIYTLGIIIYEMITGTKPFISDSDIGYFQKHLNEKPSFPDTSVVHVPSYFKDIVQKCLEKKRQNRYYSAEDILTDIKNGHVSRGPLLYRLKNKPLAKIAAIIIFLLAILGLIYILELKTGPTISPVGFDQKFSIAVLPFQDLSPGNDTPNYHGDAFSYLLTTDLEQSRYFKVLPETTVEEILKALNITESDSYPGETKSFFAQRGDVDYIITGTFAQFAHTMRLTVRVWDAKRQEYIGSDTQDTEIDQILDAIDHLTSNIKKIFNFTDAQVYADIDQAINIISTSSPEALKYYLEGKKKLNEEDYRGSIKLYKKAIRIDPGFAMAYNAIGWAYALLDDMEKRLIYLKEALSRSEHLSKREKLWIEGCYYAENEETYDKARDAFTTLVKLYPGHHDALLRLGGLSYVRWEFKKSMYYFKRAALENKSSPVAHSRIAYLHMAMGEYQKALEVIEDFLQHYPGNVRMHELQYDIYIIQGKFDLARLTLEKIFQLSSNMPGYRYKYNRGDLYYYNGDLEKAEVEYRKFLDKKDERAYLNGLKGLRHLTLLQGQYKKTIELAEKEINFIQNFDERVTLAFELLHLHLRFHRPQEAAAVMKKYLEPTKPLRKYFGRRKQFYQALIYLELKQFQKALAVTEELKKAVLQSSYKKDIKYYYFLKGRYERKKNFYKAAITDLTKAFSYLPHQMSGLIFRNQQAFFLYEIAITYYEAGNLEKAQTYFEKITPLTLGRWYFGDIYARSFYYLGKIFLGKGWEGKALEEFVQFTNLWKTADNNSPLKKDAERQVQLLRSGKK